MFLFLNPGDSQVDCVCPRWRFALNSASSNQRPLFGVQVRGQEVSQEAAKTSRANGPPYSFRHF